MRLKAFSAPTMAQAMAEVRSVLGKDAVIVSTRKGGGHGGITVMAAIETPVTVLDSEPFDGHYEGDPIDALDGILAYHRVPQTISDALIDTARTFDTQTPVKLLAGALDMRFRFEALLPNGGGALFLIGPAGGGKTIAAAKIAATALLAGKPVRLVNADTARAGSGARLHALAERLELPISDAADGDTILDLTAHAAMELSIVDLPGTNPFDADEFDELQHLLKGLTGHRMLVLPAGGDPLEAADLAVSFAPFNPRALIATRLDAATRYGGLLAAANAAQLPFAAAGIRPQIADGLATLNPMSLARSLAARSHGWDSPHASPEHAV